VLAAALVVPCAPVAAAAERPATPSGEGLRHTYPLETRRPEVRIGTRPAAQPVRGRTAARASTTDDVAPLLAVIAAVGLVAGVSLRRRGRRRHERRAPAGRLTKRSAAARPLPTTAPPEPTRDWTAEIAWRDTRPHPHFVVVAHADDGEEAEVLSSEPVQWPPRDAAGVAILERLVSGLQTTLLESGWIAGERGDAWYASRFAWAAREPMPEPPRHAGAGGVQPLPQSPKGREELCRCEIGWDPGYLASRFTAVMRAPGSRRARVVAESEPFAWTHGSANAPEGPSHAGAVEALVAALERAGWERVGTGGGWWAEQLVWRHDEPPPRSLERRPLEAAARRQ
jgi:hypothetical protein